jgi:hypothetical protein
VHESTPMRGPVYASLPATVREVAESNLYTSDAVAFVEALGARMEYAIKKNGNYYVCHHQGLEIQARARGPPAARRSGGEGRVAAGLVRDWEEREASAACAPRGGPASTWGGQSAGAAAGHTRAREAGEARRPIGAVPSRRRARPLAGAGAVAQSPRARQKEARRPAAAQRRWSCTAWRR